MDSCFALIGARQHCVAMICNASQRANAHKLQNDRSLYQVPYIELTCAQKRALPHHVFQGARGPMCHYWSLEKQKYKFENLTAWPLLLAWPLIVTLSFKPLRYMFRMTLHIGWENPSLIKQAC